MVRREARIKRWDSSSSHLTASPRVSELIAALGTAAVNVRETIAGINAEVLNT
jgi:hypothetical protein